MSKEVIYIRFLQYSVSLLTVVIIFGILQAKKGNISLHKKINGSALVITALAVVGLIVTLIMGFEYKNITNAETLLNIGPQSMNTRLMIHRCFSTPLFFALSYTAFTGIKNQGIKHRKSIPFTTFFWLGTWITALLFF